MSLPGPGVLPVPGRAPNEPGLPTVLLLRPASSASAGDPEEARARILVEGELDSAWAVRPLALSSNTVRRARGRDPGCETLDRFLPGPME
jgi:hypothetical protein